METPRHKITQKQDFDTYHKRFRDSENGYHFEVYKEWTPQIFLGHCCVAQKSQSGTRKLTKAGFLLSLKVDSQEVKVGSLVIECCRQFEALTSSLKPFFPKSIQLRHQSNLCRRWNLTLFKSICVTVPKSLFSAPACVPGFQYMPRLAQGFQ